MIQRQIDLARHLVSYILVFVSILCFGQEDKVQQNDPKPIIQFTGVVFAPDSNSVIPGVHVYLPKSGRGTTTNPYGFFSLPVREGDSVVFSAIGFVRKFYIIPPHDSDKSMRLIVTMEEDITFLNEVEVFPYPTEAMFKEAVLSLEMPNQREYNNLSQWLSQDYMSDAYANLPASPNANHQYFMQMQMQSVQNKYMAPQNNLLNPFAWARFIKSLKSGK